MSTIITPSEEQINIVVNDEKININVESGDVIVNVNEQIVEISTQGGAYPLPSTVYSVFGRTGSIIAQDGDYDLGELGDVTLVNILNGDVLSFDGTKWVNRAIGGTGTVTNIDMTVPVGLEVSGNPITTNGTLAVKYATGYSIPTNAKQTNWDAAYNDKIASANVSGTTTKTLTLTQQDGGTITASWTDIDTNLVTSINGYVGTVVLTTSDIAEGTRLYYTEARVSANTDVAANTAARHNALTIGTENGLSLSSQVLSLALASATTNGALSSTDWSTFNNKVPYTGATGNVNLGEYGLSQVGFSQFDLTPTYPTVAAGKLVWNDTDGTLDLGLKGGNVTLQIGQEQVTRVVNKTGINLLESEYKAVYISGAQGQRMKVDLALANNSINSSATLGLVTENINNNQEGFITTGGLIREVNTTGSLQGETWVDGQTLYLSATTGGAVTNIMPVAPNHKIVVGYVVYAHAIHGTIYVKVSVGQNIEQLNDVESITPLNNEVLAYNSSTLVWQHKSLPTILGYTPISLTSLSATVPLAYNNITGGFSISQAGVSANGYLTSTDWNTFNAKQAAGNYITALTGEATASGPGSSAVTLSTPAVTGKLLTGVNITGGSIGATDSILVAFGKIQNQINGVLGGAIYQSVWNASTNSPTLTSGTGTKGYYYIVSVAGATNLDGITDWQVGDWAIFNGTTWNKVDNTDAVSSVNGFTGSVSLTTSNITEGTNLYYTEARVSANTNVAANTAARHNAVTLGTANGLTLSTQQLSLGLASTSATGALSSTDWNTFNAKQPALSGTGFVKISGSTISYDNSTYYLASNPNGYTSNTGTVTSIATTGPITGGTITSSGTIGITQATTSASGYLSSTDWNTFNGKQNALTNPVTGTGTSGYHVKWTGASTVNNSVIYDDGTNIGIGTASPGYKLDVNGTGRFSSTLLVNNNASIIRSGSSLTTLGQSRYLNLSDYYGNTNARMEIGLGYSAATGITNVPALIGYLQTSSSGYTFGDLYFATRDVTTDVAPTVRFTIASTGAATFSNNVYIGSTDGAGKSLVVNGTGATSATIYFDATGKSYGLYQNGTQPNYFTGNVGIGTTSPDRALTVNGQIGLNNDFVSTKGGQVFRIGYEAYTSTGGVNLFTEGAIPLVLGTSSTERMRITSGGSLLVGLTSDRTTARVQFSRSGTIQELYQESTASDTTFLLFSTTTATGMGSITRLGTTNSVLYNTTSDYRLKHDFKDFNGLDIVNKIKTYDFAWNEDNSRNHGVIAHELQSVLSYAVHGKKDGEQMQGVDYSKLTPVNTKAIQELHALVLEQQIKMNKLELRLN